NAARFAHSAENLQPWKFIVVSDEDTKRKLAGACTNAKHMADAPLVVVACARLDEAVAMIGGYMNSYPLDLGGALANVTVAATSRSRGPFRPSSVRSAIRSIPPRRGNAGTAKRSSRNPGRSAPRLLSHPAAGRRKRSTCVGSCN